MQLTWLGHSCFLLETAAQRVLFDPFLDESPAAPQKADQIETDVICLTHGHFDHVADAASIAMRTGARVVANYEIGEWLKREGIPAEQVVAMNTGGAVDLPCGRVQMTHALHSSSLPDGTYGGLAGGYVLETDGKRLYFAGDTALFLEMKLIALGGLDLAVLPIGDLFTMGPEQSVEAIKMLAARRVVPCHYNTWPPIRQDPQAWADSVRRQTAAEPHVLTAGEPTTL